MATVAAIIIDGIRSEQAMHERGKGRLFCALDEKMKVRIHQTPGMDSEGVKVGIFSEVVHESSVIPRIHESNLPRNRPGKNMIEGKRKINSFRSCHG